MIDYLKSNLKAVLILAMLLLGLTLGLYLLAHNTIFKSKADEKSVFQSVEVTPQSDSDQVTCQSNDCTTSTKNIKMKINIKQIEALENQDQP